MLVLFSGTIDFAAINHFTAWYVIDGNIDRAPFVGAETCPPLRPDNDWEEYIASQLTGRGTPSYADEENDTQSTFDKKTSFLNLVTNSLFLLFLDFIK